MHLIKDEIFNPHPLKMDYFRRIISTIDENDPDRSLFDQLFSRISRNVTFEPTGETVITNVQKMRYSSFILSKMDHFWQHE